MIFLFIGPGFPGIAGVGHGSGIGSYLRALTFGLTKRGHECHVVVWGMQSEVRSQKSESGSQKPSPQQLNNLTTQQLPSQDLNGIKVYLLSHSYWPIVERFMPDSRDVWNMRQMVKRLDREYHYDWIEIQSEEGIGIGVQRDFPDKTILRAHTTLLQMVEYKGGGKAGDRVQGSGGGIINIDRQDTQDKGVGNSSCKSCTSMLRPSLSALQRWKLRYRLWRERRSLAMAGRITVSSKAHAEEMKRLYPGIVEPVVVYLGVAENRLEQKNAKESDASARPTFLIVGTPDRRKGFERIRPVLETYAAKYGPCRVVIVAKADEKTINGFGFSEINQSSGVLVEWKSGLSTAELSREYQGASVYLHLARYESFGLPLIEAASHGVPIVSTRVGIAPELLNGDLEGCLVEGNAPDEVADALWQVTRDRAGIGHKIRARFEEGYTEDRMVERFLESAVSGDEP